MKIMVTGSNGFIGKNLLALLDIDSHIQIFAITRGSTRAELSTGLRQVDLIFHLAGVNRPKTESEFETVNTIFTEQICDHLASMGRAVPIVFASSSQAELDNPYGKSKRNAERAIINYARKNGAQAIIYRLKNVFGKWCRPNYNSVVATFCHNIARDIPIEVSDSNRELELVHVDDVIQSFRQVVDRTITARVHFAEISPTYKVTVGKLADLIRSFRQARATHMVPNLENEFTYKLYGTYLTYLPEDDFSYDLVQRCDNRGCLAEFVKSPSFGQIFVSRTEPGVTRGDHWHKVKAEKFLVLEGEAIIRFRQIGQQKIIKYYVSGEEFRVLDIPPGYTHSIENVGDRELITLFWASEIFKPDNPDTVAEHVIHKA